MLHRVIYKTLSAAACIKHNSCSCSSGRLVSLGFHVVDNIAAAPLVD